MVDYENGCTEPESDDPWGGDTTCAGDVDTPKSGAGDGELSSQLRFFAWADDGNNIWETGEPKLFSNTEGPAGDILDGQSYELFAPGLNSDLALAPDTTKYIGMYWCYGDIDVNETNYTLSCDGAPVTNLTQTDGLSADITFYVEQARNNAGFKCPQPQPRVCAYSEVATGPTVSGVTPVTVTYTDCRTANVQKVEKSMSFSQTGWGGWSCPTAYPEVVGGGVIPGNATVTGQGAAEVGAPPVAGSNYPVYPHYTFNAGNGEEGWVVQAAGPTPPTGLYALCTTRP